MLMFVISWSANIFVTNSKYKTLTDWLLKKNALEEL